MKRVGDVGLAVIIIGVIAIVLASAVLIVSSRMQSRISLNVGDGVFTAKLAGTPSLREKGLGGVTDLSHDQALILAYPSSGKWPIDVKDMKVPLDILWLNVDKKIVYIVKNASPDSDTTVFTPKTDARFVIELPGGSVDNLSIRSGYSAVFSIDGEKIK